MTRLQFSNAVLEGCTRVQRAVFDYVSADPQSRGPIVPGDFNELVRTARRFPEQVILSPSVEDAIAVMRQDPGAVMSASFMIAQLEADTFSQLEEIAFGSVEHEPNILPMHAVSAFVLAMCENIENPRSGNS